MSNKTFGSTVKASADNTIDIGETGTKFATVHATTFSGVATSAQYADMAEIYSSDVEYEPGTVVRIGDLFCSKHCKYIYYDGSIVIPMNFCCVPVYQMYS